MGLRHGSGLRACHMLHLGHAGHEAEAYTEVGSTDGPDASGRTAENQSICSAR